MNTMKNEAKPHKLLFIVLILVVAVTCAFSLIWISGKDKREVSFNLDLGNKYLIEQNYKEAIAAYSRVLEINPMNIEAYIQLGEIYISQAKEAEQKDNLEEAISFYSSAINILQKGYDLTADSVINDKLIACKSETNGIQKELDERIAEELERAAREAEEIRMIELEQKRKEAENALIDYFMDEVKIFGLSLREYKEMSSEDRASFAIEKYGLHRREYDNNYYEYVNYVIPGEIPGELYFEASDSYIECVSWVRVNEHMTLQVPRLLMNVDDQYVIDGRNTDTISIVYDEEAIEKYVEFPEDFFPMNGTLDEIKEWFANRNIDVAEDEKGLEVCMYDENGTDRLEKCWIFISSTLTMSYSDGKYSDDKIYFTFCKCE